MQTVFFPVKVWKHTENYTNSFVGPIEILGMQIFSKDG